MQILFRSVDRKRKLCAKPLKTVDKYRETVENMGKSCEQRKKCTCYRGAITGETPEPPPQEKLSSGHNYHQVKEIVPKNLQKRRRRPTEPPETRTRPDRYPGSG